VKIDGKAAALAWSLELSCSAYGLQACAFTVWAYAAWSAPRGWLSKFILLVIFFILHDRGSFQPAMSVSVL
jgi:hypothetical protein